MAAPGQVYNQTVTVAEPPDSVIQRFVTATAGTSGYTMNTAGSNSLILTRKYTPTWAVVAAVLGAILFLIGLLALLVKNTESLTITLASTGEGTRVNISGVATPEMIARLNGALAGVQALSGDQVGAAAAPPVSTSTGDTKTCPRCAETVKAAALFCRFCGHEFEAEEEPAS